MRRNAHVLLVAMILVSNWLADDCNSQGTDSRAAWTTSNLRGQPTPPDPYKIELAFPNLKFDNPKCVVEIPGTDRLLVAHAGTKLVSFMKRKDTETTSLVADLKEIEGEYAGPNTVAFHPNFLNNRYIFVAMSHAGGGSHSRVMRYTLTDDAEPKVIPDSGKFVIRWPAGGHGGGCLEFGKDGYLYISTGDGSGPSPPDKLTTGQDVSDLLGSVLRVDVDHSKGDRNYAVPADNPFIDVENARPEIWSYGLRNPWKFGIDRVSGDIFVADNGWETWELIHKLHRGSNCGWPIMEGRARLRTEVKQGPTPITPPLKDHPHTEANSVIGGPVYRGQAFPDLDGWFVYGDYITGTVWALKSGASGEYEHRTLGDSDLHIVAFTEGSRGEIYLLDYDTTGQLYELKQSEEADTSATFPRKLSQTGLFAKTESLTPAEGVVPYQITAEPWSDGATTRRWVAIPGTASIRFDSGDSKAAQFPEGSVLVKHLSMPQGEQPLETQLLHHQNGSWNPYSYLWDDSGSDATLVDPQGVDREIQLTDDPKSKRTWHVGSTNECRLCHNAGSGVVLGFTARQLQGGAVSQLDRLVDALALTQRPSIPEENKLGDPHDEAASIDDRARSYLHMNCGVCHNHQGPATISFFAHRDYDFGELRITKQPGIGTFGIKSPQLISPGKPYSSIILYRLAKLGYGRMPYVGSRVVDSQGIVLIEEWIKSLADEDSDKPETDNVDELLNTTEGALALATKIHRGDVFGCGAAKGSPGDKIKKRRYPWFV